MSEKFHPLEEEKEAAPHPSIPNDSILEEKKKQEENNQFSELDLP
jgi:hypothetical protein